MHSLVQPFALFLLALPLGSVMLGIATLGVAAAQAPSASAAALKLRDATPAQSRSALELPFTDDARRDWHYVPRSRAGIAWREMNAAQREATRQLLRSALNDKGLDKVDALMALEIALREIESRGRVRDPENYAIALYGRPNAGAPEGKPKADDTAEPWGWRIEGHHLSLHFTLAGDRYLSTLPQFLGANPARVLQDTKDPAGPRQGVRVLAEEEDLARELMAALPPAQRTSALFDQRPYGDIVTRNAAELSPLSPVGVALQQLSAPSQALLLRLIRSFAEHLRPELVEQRLARVRAGGLDGIRFGWAGSLTRGEPYYFRIQGATFLIEHDNSGGNHIHSVWRDFEGDWGRDTLREHYQGAAAGRHSHGKR